MLFEGNTSRAKAIFNVNKCKEMSKTFIKVFPTKEVKRISQILEPIEYKRFYFRELRTISDFPRGLSALAYNMSYYNKLRYYLAFRQLAYSMKLTEKTPKEINALKKKGDLFYGVFTDSKITNYVLIDLVLKLVDEAASSITGGNTTIGKIMLSSFGNYPNKFGIVVDSNSLSTNLSNEGISKLLDKLSVLPELEICDTEIYTRYAEDYVQVKQIFLNEEYILSHYYKEEITEMIDLLENSIKDEKTH